MGELLHAGAVVSTAVGACCVAADRPTGRVRELALAVLMLGAMLDVVLGAGLVPAPWWAVMLIVASVASIIGTKRSDAASVRGMRAADAVGGVLMAGLLLVMAGGHDPAGAHAAHAASPAVLLTAAAIPYALVCVGLAQRMREHRRPRARSLILRRIPPIAMAASVVLMAVATLA